MIAKVQLDHCGWEWIDKVKRLLVGRTLSAKAISEMEIGLNYPMRHINTSPADGDHGPYVEITLVFEDGTHEIFETNGNVYLLSENGKTVDKI
jgi:hypothetical protein